MKQCPACSARYEDEVSFCTKDGRALSAIKHQRARLCPHCANSIEQDAAKCPYCKADLTRSGEPQWPMREEESGQATPGHSDHGLSTRSKAILAAGFLVFALGVFLIGGYQQRSETQRLEDSNLKKLQERELTIQTLEGQLKKTRQELDDSKNQLAALTAKLQDSQKELSATQQQLSNATREAARLASKSAPASRRSAARSGDAPAATTQQARRSAEPGVYEVIRTTTVRQDPSASAPALAEIKKGTKIVVRRPVGEWLEVRSRQGNPPGFIRVDDATFVSRVN